MQPECARKAAASQSACSALAASLLVLVLGGWFVSATIASGVRARAVRSAETVYTTAPPAVAETTVGRDEDGVQVRHLIAPEETFRSILVDRGLAAAEVQAWEQAATSAFSLRKIRPRHALLLTFAKDQAQLVGCDYEIDEHSLLSMRLVHGQIRARLKVMPQVAAVRGVAGRIESGLATSASAAGVPLRTISELAEVFGWEVDLHADVRADDEFRLLYAELRDEDGTAQPGDVLAAEITSGGRTLTAIRFENERGEREYYDVEGRALGQHFLKYPVEFTEISSEFTGSRLHPVLKQRRPHVGVDFAAPMGTPVRAVASGVVTFAGWNGAYGTQVGIDHEGRFASSYSHLRGLARGVRHRATVQKGQVIGYVGRTGLATGPHLHFMLFRDGAYVDPLSTKLSTAERLTGTRWKRFARLRADLLARLAGLGSSLRLPALSMAPSVPGMIRSHAASRVD